jgi:hypothetical protein
MRLSLPKHRVEHPARCDQAKVPANARKLASKREHALDIASGVRWMRFARVDVDAGAARSQPSCGGCKDENEVFVADVPPHPTRPSKTWG